MALLGIMPSSVPKKKVFKGSCKIPVTILIAVKGKRGVSRRNNIYRNAFFLKPTSMFFTQDLFSYVISLDANFVLKKITQPPKLADKTTQIVAVTWSKRKPPIIVRTVATGIERLTIRKYINEKITRDLSKC